MFDHKHLILYVWPWTFYIMLLQYPVFIGAFPFSQDLEFDLKLNSFNVSPKIKTHGTWPFRSRGCYVNSPRNVEKKRFKSWIHKKGGSKIWESARGLDFRGAVRPLWSWEVGIWVVRWWFLIGGKGGWFILWRGSCRFKEVILLMRIKKERSVKEITLGDKLWLRLWSKCEVELVMIDDGVKPIGHPNLVDGGLFGEPPEPVQRRSI